jgi:O-antigen/teichoic acid export membrane protein
MIKLKIFKANNLKNNIILYSVGDLFNKGISFLTIPIFTRILNTAEYGVLSIYQTLFSIFVVLLGLNITEAVTQKLLENSSDSNIFIKVNLKLLLILFFFSISIVMLLFPFIDNQFWGLSKKYLALCVLDSGFMIFVGFLQGIQVAQRKSRQYVLNSTLITSGGMLISLVLMIFIFPNEAILGRIIGKIIVPFFFFVYIIYENRELFKYSIIRYKSHIKYSLLFGVPLIPHILFHLVTSQFDRIIITKYVGINYTGIYSLAFNLSLIFPIMIGSINKAWIPVFQQYLREEKYSKVEEIVKKLTLLLFSITAIAILMSDKVYTIIAPVAYFEGYKVFQLIVAATFVMFIYNVYVNYSYYSRKTYSMSVITIVVGIISLGLNIILIPLFKMMGAAYSYIISSIMMAILHYLNAKYFMKLKVVKLEIFGKYALLLALMLIAIMGYDKFLFNTTSGFIIRAIVIIVFLTISLRIGKQYFYKERLSEI